MGPDDGTPATTPQDGGPASLATRTGFLPGATVPQDFDAMARGQGEASMDLFGLTRPDHVEDPAWHAVETARARVQAAWALGDMSEAIGKAKELVETVAKVVATAAGEPAADAMDFAPLVKRAQRALSRQPGANLSQDQNIRAMAQAAQTLATSIGSIRNSHGTGHGRDRVPDVVDEMATITVEAALLWSRWALRRLGHLLADYPNDLIEAVNIGTSRGELRERFEAAALAQQPEEVQQSIGVAFGQQAAGGYGNAVEVGVTPAIDGGYDQYPIGYRVGLLKGMLLTAGGHIGLTTYYTERFVSLLTSLPEDAAKAALEEGSQDVQGASWLSKWRGSTQIDHEAVVVAMRAEADRVPQDYRDRYVELCDALAAAADRSRPAG